MVRGWTQVNLRLVFLVGGAIASSSQCVFAQSITLDGTLGTARTLNGTTYTIQQADGQTVGNNLFHSFGRFNLNQGETAIFQSGSNIQNIISRVTGGSRSTIDGSISAGNVNLFLINPSGIVFGPNASLNIGSSTRGSFVATTLDGLVWANGGQFSATNPSGPSSLLTLVGDPSGFLSSLRPPQPLTASSSSLSVAEGKSLLLLGGNLTLDNTKLSAPGGQIELAGVTGAGTVGLGVNGNILKLNTPESITRGDVSLVNNSVVDVSSNDTYNAGNINIKAGNITVNNQNGTTKNQNATALKATTSGQKTYTGNIALDASGSISITGSNESEVFSAFGDSSSLGSGNISLKANGSISLNDAFLNVSNQGGNAGNITIQGNKSVSLSNNSSLASTAFFRGNSGSITLESANGSVSFQNSLVSTSAGVLGASNFNSDLGNAGNIAISGKSVLVSDGAEVSSRSFSGLKSGDININASDLVELSGFKPYNPETRSSYDPNSRSSTIVYSAILTTSEEYARGSGGNIDITTNTLRVLDGASLRSQSDTVSRGGNITVTANVAELLNGGQLLTSALSSGNAGTIRLNAANSVTIDGSNSSAGTISKQVAQQSSEDEARFIGQLVLGSGSFQSGIFANTLGNSTTVKGGDINITTRQLQVQNRGSVTVSSPKGEAGNLTINARDIRLNQGSLTADTAITGANINLQGLDLLLLQNGSRISAGASSNATAGNIRIDATNGVVVAPLLQNNDIIANAIGGQGGNITISSEQIFGLTKGKYIPGNSTNVVDASSEFSSPGIVTFNTLDIDPSLGLITLPTVVVEASKLVDTSCTTASRTKFNELTVTGRGGLPPSPYEPLTSDATWSDNRLPNIVSVQKLSKSQRLSNRRVPLETKDHIAIAPATGWVFNNKGEVTLIANSSYNVPSNTSSCLNR